MLSGCRQKNAADKHVTPAMPSALSSYATINYLPGIIDVHCCRVTKPSTIHQVLPMCNAAGLCCPQLFSKHCQSAMLPGYTALDYSPGIVNVQCLWAMLPSTIHWALSTCNAVGL